MYIRPAGASQYVGPVTLGQRGGKENWGENKEETREERRKYTHCAVHPGPLYPPFPPQIQFVPSRVETYDTEAAPLEPAYELKGPEDTTLLFESRFESGNLQRAYKL